MKYGRGVVQKLPSGKWRVRVPDGRGGHRSIGSYPTEAEAQRMLDAAAIVRSEQQQFIGQTVAQYGDLVIQRWRQAGKRSTGSDDSRWKQLVIPHAQWARSPLDSVNRGEVREWTRALLKVRGTHGKRLSSQTIKHALNLVRRIFAEAVEDELIATNPAQGVKPPRRADEHTDNWTSLTSRDHPGARVPFPHA